MNVHFIQFSGFLLLAGCAFDPAGGGDAPGEDEQPLVGQVDLDIQRPWGFEASVTDGSGQPVAFSAPEVTGGHVRLWVTDRGQVWLEQLDVQLTDFALDKVKDGVAIRIELADVAVRLAEPALLSSSWRDDGAPVAGVAGGDLLLDWSLVGGDGEAHPLAAQKIRGAEIAIRVDRGADAGLSTTLETVAPGRIWDFGDLEVSDLFLRLTALER